MSEPSDKRAEADESNSNEETVGPNATDESSEDYVPPVPAEGKLRGQYIKQHFKGQKVQ
jgi:hypothetical protein